MINLEQIQTLETRVNKAVELIKSLKAENQSLRRTLDSAQARMQELEKLVGDFRSDQKDIEDCILRALGNLDELEDEISEQQGQEENKPKEEEEEESLPFEAKEGDGSGELDIF